jgi:hypothetical protein
MCKLVLPPPTTSVQLPYSLMHCSEPADAFHGSWLLWVKLGIIHQLGSLGWQATDLSSALLHGGLHFYSHVLHQSDVVILHMPEDQSEVCCYWSFCYSY